MSDAMHVLVLGATGKTGRQVVVQALARGLRVTVFVRDAARLGVPAHPQLSIAIGDIQDAATLDAAFATRPDAVISALGITVKEPRTPLADGTRNVLAAMARHGVRRLVVVSSLGAGDSRGQGTWLVRMIQKHLLRHTLDDKTQQEALIAASGVTATILRPPQLTDSDVIRDDIVLWSGPQPARALRWKVSRATVARYALEAAVNGRHANESLNMAEAA